MAAPSLIRTLGGETGFGESFLAANDDGSTSAITISEVFENGLNFFGTTYDQFFINNNGNITFNNRISTFTPQTIAEGTTAGIFPYWGDVDTQGGPGTISPGGASRGTNLVYYDFDTLNDRIVITWDDVGYYNNGTDRVSAFQLILEDASNDPGRVAGDFNIEFRYEDVNWTAGSASGGSGGVGGTPSRAGYSAGNDARTFFELPTSGNEEAMLGLESNPGNTGLDGIWRFQVANGEVPQTLSIRNAENLIEGDSGIQIMSFQVDRTGNLSGEVTVQYTALGFGANPAFNDDVVGSFPNSGEITFAEGETVKTVEVQVRGDNSIEEDEIVTVILSDPEATGGTTPVFASIQGFGTIIDDDSPAPPPPPPGFEADIFGDPHLVTLDGLGYDFHAVGEFILLEARTGDPLTVQIRTAPISDVVSVTTAMATQMDGIDVTIDTTRDVPLWVNGSAVEIGPSDGAYAVGNSGAEIYAEGSMFTLVMSNGEQLKIAVTEDGFMNVCAFLSNARPLGSVQGLLGNANNDTTDDLALRDGTVLSQPVAFAELYSTYADSWRIGEAEALFDRAPGETTADFTDTSYPRSSISIDDLPDSVRNEAIAAVDAAGITDPIIRDAAIIDYALTGQSVYVTAATTLAADPEVQTEATGAPAPGATLLVSNAGTQQEGNSGAADLQFTVERFGNTDGALTVNYTVGGDVDAQDISGALSGSVQFADGDTSQTITVAIAGDTDVELDERMEVRLSVDGGAGITFANRVGVAVIEDDDGIIFREGTSAADRLTGDIRDNSLFGRQGDDTLNGGQGEDTLFGGEGQDVLIGAEGDDFITGGTTDTDLRDVVYSGDGNDRVNGGAGNDELRGDGGNDSIEGGDGVDTVIGGAGDDVLTGSAFSDVVLGGSGADFINGGFGSDRVNGGADADRFYHIGLETHGSDWIQDFNHLEGDRLLYGSSASASDFQVNFASTAAAGAAGVQEAFVIHQPSGHIVWALVDGAGQDSIMLQVGNELVDLLV